MFKKYFSECLGTFWLVLGGCGSAVFSATFPKSGIGFLGVSLAFGLTVLTMAFSLGRISGCHLNPAVTVGLYVAGKFELKQLPGFIFSQIIGAVVAAIVLYLIASGKPGFILAQDGLAANGYGVHSPGHYALTACFISELILTFMFLMIIIHANDKLTENFAPIAIGLALTLIHLISIPITNTSVNPARSTGPALLMGGWAIKQLWLFWLAPLMGGCLGGVVHRLILEPTKK